MEEEGKARLPIELENAVQYALDNSISLPKLIVESTEPLAEVNGLKIYHFRQPDDPGHPIGVVLGELVVDHCRLLDLLTVVNSSGMRRLWDDLFDGSTILGGPLRSKCGSNLIIVHSKTRAVWPTSARDLVVAITIKRHNDSILMSACSIPESAYTSLPFPIITPRQTGCVRAQLDFGAWIFTPLTGAGNQPSTDTNLHVLAGRLRVRYLVKTHPNGSIPRTILAMLSRQLPLCVRQAVNCHQKRGFCPSLVRSCASIRQLENFYDPNIRRSRFRLLRCQTTDDGQRSAFIDIRIDLSDKWMMGGFQGIQIDAPFCQQCFWIADIANSAIVRLQWKLEQEKYEITIWQSAEAINESENIRIFVNGSLVPKESDAAIMLVPKTTHLGINLLDLCLGREESSVIREPTSIAPKNTLIARLIPDQQLAGQILHLLDIVATAETTVNWIRIAQQELHGFNYLIEELPWSKQHTRVSTILFDEHPAAVVGYIKRLVSIRNPDIKESRRLWQIKQMICGCPCFSSSSETSKPTTRKNNIGLDPWCPSASQLFPQQSSRLGCRYYMALNWSGIDGCIVEQLFVHPHSKSLLSTDERELVVGGTRLMILSSTSPTAHRFWQFAGLSDAEYLMRHFLDSIKSDSDNFACTPFLLFPDALNGTESINHHHRTLLASRGELEETHAPIRIIDESFEDFTGNYRLSFAIDRPPVNRDGQRADIVELFRVLVHSSRSNDRPQNRCYQVDIDSEDSAEISALIELESVHCQQLFVSPSKLTEKLKATGGRTDILRRDFQCFHVNWVIGSCGWPEDEISYPITAKLTLKPFMADIVGGDYCTLRGRRRHGKEPSAPVPLMVPKPRTARPRSWLLFLMITMMFALLIIIIYLFKI